MSGGWDYAEEGREGRCWKGREGGERGTQSFQPIASILSSATEFWEVLEQVGDPTTSAVNSPCVCEPPPPFFICELWGLDSI